MKPLFYTNGDTNSPQLTNDWGSLYNLLKQILVNGFGEVQGVTINRIDDQNLSIYYEKGLSYQNESSVFIKNVLGLENIQFYVKELISPNTYRIKCYDNPPLPSIEQNSLGSIYRKSLGYKLAFDDPTNFKGVFTNKNGWNLRVYDNYDTNIRALNTNFPAETSNYSKYARVSFGREMINIDTWKDIPNNYNASFPNSWNGFIPNTNQTFVSSDIWLYANMGSGALYTTTVSKKSAIVPYFIIGTDTCFYLYINWDVAQSYPIASPCYMFGEFDSLIGNDNNNVLMSSITNTLPTFTAYSDNSNGFQFSGDRNFNLATNYNQQKTNTPTLGNLKYIGTQNYSGNSSIFDIVGNGASSIMYSPMYIVENSKVLRGKFKGANAILNKITNLYSQALTSQSHLYINQYDNQNISDKKFLLKPSCTSGNNNIESYSTCVMFDLYSDW